MYTELVLDCDNTAQRLQHARRWWYMSDADQWPLARAHSSIDHRHSRHRAGLSRYES